MLLNYASFAWFPVMECDDELDDYEYPEPDRDDDDMIVCPVCNSDVYEDAPSCPSCGHYLSDSDRIQNHAPWRAVAILLLAMIALFVLITVVRIATA